MLRYYLICLEACVSVFLYICLYKKPDINTESSEVYVQNVPTLVGVSKAAHATHDTEHVVVRGIDTDLGTVDRTDCVVGEGEDECGIVNAGEVARA